MARDLVPHVERIFGLDHEGDYQSGDDSEMTYEAQVRAMIEDARDYSDQVRTPKREEYVLYYSGAEPALEEEGRSTIVATEVRDTILSIMPSMMRIFTAHEHVVEYIPSSQHMVAKAAEATEYVHNVFMEDNSGFLILHSIFKDALIKGEGVVKWWTDEEPHFETQKYEGLTQEQYQFVISMPNVEVIEAKPRQMQTLAPQPDGSQMPQMVPVVDLTIRVGKYENVHRVEAVPPDEFRIDRMAKGVCNAQLVGHERVATPSELIEMGYDRDTVEDHAGTNLVSVRWSMERTLRNEGLEQGHGNVDHNGGVLYGEYFIRIDKDGDGIAELRRICTMGDSDDIVSDEPATWPKFAFFCPDPEPHTAVGHSVTELVMDLQRIKSNLLRNSLDSIAATIFPRLAVVENMVNMDDVLNTEMGAPIRVRSADAVNQLNTQFIGEAPMTMIQYLDMVRAQRTGITDASKGLDPAALQSTTMKGVDMVITGAQERIELIARIFAETGMKDMFKGLLREVIENPNPGRTIKIADSWIPVQPDTYDPAMGVRVNPSLGRGSDMDRFAILTQVMAKQELIMQTMGIDNDMVSPIEYRNTLQDLLAIGSIKNVDRYFKAVSLEQIQQRMQQKAQAAQQDPALIVALNEREKLRQATVKAVADDGFRHEKLHTDDQFRRDKLEVDSTLKGASESLKAVAQHHQQDKQHAHEKDIKNADQAHDAFGKGVDHQQHTDKLQQADRHKALDAHLQRQSLEDKMTSAESDREQLREAGTKSEGSSAT